MKKLVKGLISRTLPRKFTRRALALWQYWRYRRAYGAVASKKHGLPASLIISLTSFPPRFATLDLTLATLLHQRTKADHIILWIAQADFSKLTPKIKKKLNQGVQLRLVDDVRSYKKLVFAVDEFPESYIVTADDDVFYPPDWLGELVEGQAKASGVITCHRVHRVTKKVDGAIAPYSEWERDVQDEAAYQPSCDLMPTGIGGILYPPRWFHPDLTERTLFERYAPSADDLWFFWCARRAGSQYMKVGGQFRDLSWEGSQENRLYDHNLVENDRQIISLVSTFGDPLAMPAADTRMREERVDEVGLG